MNQIQKKSNGFAVYLLSLGCAKNLVDSECMSSILLDDGHHIVETPDLADVLIVNTCGFIESAKQEAIDSILALAEHKQPTGRAALLLVTGCLAQRYATEIKNSLPEVDAVLGTGEYDRIAQTIRKLATKKIRSDEYFAPGDAGSLKHLNVKRKPSGENRYVYVKIAEGCSNCCSYCAIPGIRGPFQSRPMADILAEARRLADDGYDELILIAQDTTRYGLDLEGRRLLPELVEQISRIEKVRLIRILYVYADGLTDELIDVMKSNAKVAHYLDLPIQHASDAVLKQMNRRDTQQSLRNTIQRLRQAIPDLILRSTVLVGFPGETEADFDELLQFLSEVEFERLGCFVFSPEEGTPAYDMDKTVDVKTAQQRYDQVMTLQQAITEKKNHKRIGDQIPVVLESIDDHGIFFIGRSYGEAPDVDPVIFVADTNDGLTLGQTCLVELVDASEYDLTGVTVH